MPRFERLGPTYIITLLSTSTRVVSWGTYDAMILLIELL